jgi:hypothetical protein
MNNTYCKVSLYKLSDDYIAAYGERPQQVFVRSFMILDTDSFIISIKKIFPNVKGHVYNDRDIVKISYDLGGCNQIIVEDVLFDKNENVINRIEEIYKK